MRPRYPWASRRGRIGLVEHGAFLAGIKVWGVKFHQLQVMKGTALEEMYERGEVRLLELDEYASAIVDCIEALPPATIVHRLCGDAPLEHLIAPRWGVNKFIVMDRIRRLFDERGAYQGRTSAGINYLRRTDARPAR